RGRGGGSRAPADAGRTAHRGTRVPAPTARPAPAPARRSALPAWFLLLTGGDDGAVAPECGYSKRGGRRGEASPEVRGRRFVVAAHAAGPSSPGRMNPATTSNTPGTPTREGRGQLARGLPPVSFSPGDTAMAQRPLRVGLVGAGANTRLRHIPGLRALPGVELVAVSNRRPSSTEAVAREHGIPRTFEHWQDLVADADI